MVNITDILHIKKAMDCVKQKGHFYKTVNKVLLQLLHTYYFFISNLETLI